jgi:hypothetical protein
MAHAKTIAHDSFPILCRSLDQPDMLIRSKAKFTCRCCAASVEADAGHCYRCGVVYPLSELRAVVLSPTAIPFYAVMVLGLITLWFL